MSKKRLWMAGSLLVLGLGILASASFAQDQPLQTRTRAELRTMFCDENGDGINDVLRDHDGDGIPNGLDPDWAKPQDGTGNQYRRSGQGLNRSQGAMAGMNSAAFRNNGGGLGLGMFGSGVCDGTGSKGQALRRGRR